MNGWRRSGIVALPALVLLMAAAALAQPTAAPCASDQQGTRYSSSFEDWHREGADAWTVAYLPKGAPSEEYDGHREEAPADAASAFVAVAARRTGEVRLVLQFEDGYKEKVPKWKLVAGEFRFVYSIHASRVVKIKINGGGKTAVADLRFKSEAGRWKHLYFTRDGHH